MATTPLTNFNVDLETVFGLAYDIGPAGDGISTIGDEFPIGTDAARVALAQAKYGMFIGWCLGIDPNGGPPRVATPGAPIWTNAEILTVSTAVACEHEAVWMTGGAVYQNWVISAPPLSRGNIIFSHGSWQVNFPMITCYGSYRGQGSSQYAAPNNAPNQTTGGTRLFIDHTNWIDKASPERYIFRSVNFIEEVGGVCYGGINGNVTYTNMLAIYMEGFRLEGFRLDGMKSSGPGGGTSYNAAYHCSGIAVLNMGSGSKIECNQCDNFNNAGIELVGGTPATLVCNRTFFNNYAGVWIRGEAKVFAFSHEADENPAVWKVEDYSTTSVSGIMQPGCVLTVTGGKCETGTQGDPARRGQMLLDAEGWICATFTGVDYVGTNSFPECLIRIQPTSNESYVKVEGLRVFGFVRSLLHHADGANGKKWKMDLDDYTKKYQATIHNFTYNSGGGGSLTTLTGTGARVVNTTYNTRMMWLDEDGGGNPVGPLWDDIAGTPVYTY